jgi:hypothetical protein
MRFLLNVFLFGITSLSVSAQNPASQATPIPTSKTSDQIRQENVRKQQEDEWLKKTTTASQINNDLSNTALLPSQRPVPSAPTAVQPNREQAKRLRPAAEDLGKYTDFLKQPNTKLVRLFSDLGCSDKNVVRVDGPCLDSIPLSSFYSFRKKNYAEKKLSDIVLRDNTFFIEGLHSNGIIIALGDISLESISVNSDGMKFLTDYQPAVKKEEILRKSEELSKGVSIGNYKYTNTSPVKENTTYALRIIAYRGSLLQPFEGNYYDELGGDKRIDIIGIFRVVRKDQEGGLTLLWKELRRKDSPKIKISKEDK